MTINRLSEKAQRYLQVLCLDLPERRLGSSGNRAASRLFSETLTAFDFQTESQEFDCLDWSQGAVHLNAAGQYFEVYTSPYSLGCRLKARLVKAGTMEELRASQPAEQILFLHGELAQEQLMPKNFTFYNPERHQQIISLLEAKKPRAIIAATSRNPELAGGMYPFPLIEDGDFDIPSVYMTEEEGRRLADFTGREVSLLIEATRTPSRGCNVIGRKGSDFGATGRLVVCAHIDAKDDTPGALDNAAGVVVLLLLAELLQDYGGRLELELVALNGEDHYSAQGQKEYLKQALDSFGDIVLAVNIDSAGYIKGHTEYSLYECPEKVAKRAHQAFSAEQDFVEGSPWYQSDHSIFIQNGVPAMAITSERFMELSSEITHTPKDRPELVDPGKLVNIARALQQLVLALE